MYLISQRRMISRLSNSGAGSLLLNSLFRYSTTEAAAPPNVMSDFLIKSLGFSKEEALAAAQKVPVSKSFRNDPNLVIGFFEKLGLNKSQIKSIVSTYPRVLLPHVHKSFKPKIKVLQDIGLSGSDLIRVLTSYKSLLCRSLESDILPPIEYLRNLLGSKELVCKAVLRHTSLLHTSTVKKLGPNMLFLQETGFSQKNLSRLMIRNPRYLLREPRFLEEVVEKVENKYKISRNSKMFFHGLLAVCTSSAVAIDKKLNIFRSFGWSEENIHVMFRTVPYIVGFSEARLRKALDFFTNEIGCKPDYLAKHPVLLNFSLEKRVKPRLKVMKILQEKGLMDGKHGFYSALSMTDLDFFKRYILPYQDESTLSIKDLEFLKNYLLPHKDEMPDLYEPNLKLLVRKKRKGKKD